MKAQPEAERLHDMTEAFICDYIRTPIGRFGGALSSVRPDDLAAARVVLLPVVPPVQPGPHHELLVVAVRVAAYEKAVDELQGTSSWTNLNADDQETERALSRSLNSYSG